MSRHGASILLTALVAACSAPGRAPAADGQQLSPNTLTAEEQGEGFKLLFDGATLNGWRGFKRADAAGWDVVEGTIHHATGEVDLLTVEEFQDFELRLDWRISPGGNSGIFYRGTEEYDEIYWSAPEMQVLDDSAHADAMNRLTAAGSDYALYPAPAGVVHRAGEWNSVRIIARGHHVEHWMNGVKVVEYELDSPDWRARVAASKFHAWPNYGKASKGHIAVQVHGGDIRYRNVRIRTY